jgi:hypothetical protein
MVGYCTYVGKRFWVVVGFGLGSVMTVSENVEGESFGVDKECY